LIKPHRYCALGAEISSDWVLPELQTSDSASDALMQIQQGNLATTASLTPLLPVGTVEQEIHSSFP
jgi:hypothetical protein|tara:strand:+ start:628 stop:825 length:198 start_codon:yes stop_codon:yes gene_type:complete